MKEISLIELQKLNAELAQACEFSIILIKNLKVIGLITDNKED
ncbi:MAG: hypothetical protein UT41_C0007G0004 [Candidatus Wolfebacteria bacterium GW2011_GWC2_39_22]|uniref:Uncharacterized protein n=1 Tax=Candidatus Wolfebacteria bacterium GW2011_GWC2_39_22 TaxID=1619013 RepID=A0A0G0NFY9_9BACT|nr:MAG: hypothetical protein UT41_C0007G0004 [Candidatus Wolfebacteria bacterium GW2011_GWC2_39_22]